MQMANLKNKVLKIFVLSLVIVLSLQQSLIISKVQSEASVVLQEKLQWFNLTKTQRTASSAVLPQVLTGFWLWEVSLRAKSPF